MKIKFLILLTVLAGFVSAHATNGVTVGAVSLSQGGTGTIDIELNNDDYVFTAFTFSLTLPEGLSFVLNASGKPTFEKSDRFDESHTVSSSVSGQVATFGCLSGEKAAITGTSGVLLRVPVKADAVLAASTELQATLSDLTFTTTGVSEVPFDNVTVDITITKKTYTVLDETSTTAPEASDGEVDIKVQRIIKANEWSTICLPFAMTGTQMKSAFGEDVQLADFIDYEAEEDNNENVTGLTINFEEVNANTGMEANYPYLIKVSSEISEFEVKATIETDEEGAVVEYDNGKTGSRRKVYGSLIGTYHAGDAIPANGLFLSGDKFWYSTGATIIKAFRAYFMFVDVLDGVEGAEAKMRINIGGKETAVEGISSTLSDGEGAWYTLDGRRLSGKPAKKGVYIRENKKVMVK